MPENPNQITPEQLLELCKYISPGALVLTRLKVSWNVGSWFAWLVRRATDEKGDKSRVSHTAIFYGIVDNVPMVIESSWRVRIYSLIEYMNRNNQNCIIYQHKGISELGGKKIVEYASTYLGKKYGGRTIGRMAGNKIFRTTWFTRRLKETKAYNIVCSVLAEISYRIGAKMMIVSGDTAMVSPDQQHDACKNNPDIWREIWNGIEV